MGAQPYPVLYTPQVLTSWPGNSEQRDYPEAVAPDPGDRMMEFPDQEATENSAIFRAIRSEDAAKLEELLRQGGSIERLLGWTPFLFAVALNRQELLPLFLPYRDDLGHQELDNGWNALHVAARSGSLAAAKFLLEQLGMNVNTAVPASGQSPLLLAIQARQRELAAFLLKQGAEAWQEDAQGFQALHYAVLYADSLVLPLLQATAELEINARNVQDMYGQTPLYLAAWSGQLSLVKLLLESDADPNIANAQGWWPLAAALTGAYTGSLDVFDLLTASSEQELSDLNLVADYCGETILHLAAKRGSINFMERILQLGVDVDLRSQACGETPLHLAVNYDSLLAAQLLVQRGADIENRDQQGNTAFLLAVSQGSVPMLQLLLDSGADSQARNGAGESVWELLQKREEDPDGYDADEQQHLRKYLEARLQ